MATSFIKDSKQARLLLGLAKREFQFLKAIAESEVFYNEFFGFHVQQTIEKLFKAWLAILNVAYPHTHDLKVLLDTLNEQQADTTKFTHLTIYTPYSVQIRYEGMEVEALPIDKNHAIQCLEELFQVVERKLEED